MVFLYENIFLKNIQKNTQNVKHETFSKCILYWDKTFAQRISDKGPLSSTIKVIKSQHQHGEGLWQTHYMGCRSLAETQLQGACLEPTCRLEALPQAEILAICLSPVNIVVWEQRFHSRKWSLEWVKESTSLSILYIMEESFWTKEPRSLSLPREKWLDSFVE